MKKTDRQKITVKRFIEETCKSNDLNHAYLIIRAKVPVSWKQVKDAYIKINGGVNEIHS
jgi:hypothetical protein